MGRRQGRGREVRLIMVGVGLVLLWFALGYRLFQVQAFEAESYASEGVDQRVRHEELPAPRGTIYDRDGVELAVTVDAMTIVADPTLIEDAAVTARILAPAVGVDEAALRARLLGEGRFAYVARSLDTDRAEHALRLIEDFGLDGVSITTEPKRTYPAGALASSLIGFVRSDNQQGLEGLEYSYNAELTGTAGTRIVERDAYGTPIPQADVLVEPAIAGSDVVLTIDREIQYAAEEALAAALIRTNAAAGSVVVLDVDSGEILAIANMPTYDPNDRSDFSSESFRNRAVADVYEPGSTLKVVTIAAALEEGIVSPRTEFDVPAELLIHDKTYTDVGRKKDEVMTVAEIVARSSNIGTILVQGFLGNDRHFHYLSQFGLGSAPGSGLPGESSGQLHPLPQWCDTTCGPSTAIGYRVDVTPLQMAAVFAAIANDGLWVQPHVVKDVIDGDGSRTTVEMAQRQVISPETAATMRLLLRGVVDSGTGERAAVAGYQVGGKTGTTEKLIPGVGYSDKDRIASFIGIAPIDEPEIVIAVVLDSPRTPAGAASDAPRLEFGGVSAAPVFAEVAEAALHQLGIAPRGG